MLRFAARRLFFIVIVSVCIVFFSFLGVLLMGSRVPDAPQPAFLPALKTAAQETLIVFSGLVRGDLGTVETISGERPVIEILGRAYKNSLGLVLIALAAAASLGVLAGLAAGFGRQWRREYLILLVTIIGISAPSFLIAVLLQQGGIYYTTTVGRRLVSMGGYAWDFEHLAMPLLVLLARPLAYITRATFLALRSVQDEDYIRTAYAKGLAQRRVIWGHALKNLAVPILTAIGVSFRFSLSVLPVVEFIYAWPGMGLEILKAINNRAPLMVAILALAIGLTIQLISLLLDASFRIIDPRIRENA